MEKKITTVREPARDIPVRASADILILGGGPAGVRVLLSWPHRPQRARD